MNIDNLSSDKNDIYLFFEVIRQTAPRSVLDVGLFLQHIGMISRQAMNCEIPASVKLTGWNVLDHSILPVYETIYDKIENSASKPDTLYDLVFLFHINDFLDQASRRSLWDQLISHGKYIIADGNDSEFLSYMKQKCSLESVFLEQQPYLLIHTPDHN